MTRGTKYTIATGVFYGLLSMLISLLAPWLPGGICGPSVIVSLMMLIPVFAVIGLLFSFIGLRTGHPSFKGPTLIHAGILFWCVVGYFFIFT
jgi:hypothetical protein